MASEVQKLVPSEHNGKWGFIDIITEEVIVPYRYDDARYFTKEGKAKVKLNGEAFFIDVNGNRVE